MFRQIFIIIIFLFLPFFSQAAVLYLEPIQGEYYQGDTFIVNARVDTEKEECINTVEGNLSFPPNLLEIIDFSQGNSVLTIWVEEPKIQKDTGLISFIGGIPGGYCGVLPGDPGESNLLGRIVFQVRETDAKLERETDAKVEFLDTSQVLLNDGMGTPAKLTFKKAVFTILPEKLEVPKDEWQAELEKDTIPPEEFKFEIQSDPSISEGKYFITFLTSDKQTGIDHYEIKEGKGSWQRTTSPYVLEDQALQSIIKVKAVDKAGNERIAEYVPPKKPFPWWIIVLILIGVGVGYWIGKSVKRKAKNAK